MPLPSTFAVLSTLLIIAAAWEIWTICNRKPGDTFSATIFRLAQGQPFIAFMYGMLGTHLFANDPTTLAAFHAGIASGQHWPLKDKELTKNEPLTPHTAR